MTPQDIVLNGETLTPDPLGAIYWAREETLVVSDLHFEKGSSYAAMGQMLPPYDTRTTLMRLGTLLRRYTPKRIISLGDAFHDSGAEERMEERDAETLANLVSSVDWIWVLGNHDPAPPARFAAPAHQEIDMGALVFRHEPLAENSPGEIAGHLHPCAKVVMEGRSLRRRCFAVGTNRLIMPAMGAYTGGLNVLDAAYAPLWTEFTAWVIGAKGVYPIHQSMLASDQARPVKKARAS